MVGTDRYAWNAKAQRYYDRLTGRFVTRDMVRAALDDVIGVAEARITDASERFRARAIDLAEWQRVMRDTIKLVFLDALAAARGGWAQLTEVDLAEATAAIGEQYQYLARFTDAIRDGLALDGRFLLRATMYARSARGFYHDVQGDQMEQAAGYTEELNVLHEAEHCEECLDQTALGWSPIGSLVPIGQRTCLSQCRCTMRYR